MSFSRHILNGVFYPLALTETALKSCLTKTMGLQKCKQLCVHLCPTRL